MPKRKRNRYTDQFRADAVLFMEAAGYPAQKGALERVSKELGVPTSTLHRWFRGKNNPPPAELVIEKRIDLIAAIRREITKIIPEFDLTRGEADYKSLMTAFAILIDKWAVLDGHATQRIDVDHTHAGQITHSAGVSRITELLDAARTRRDRGDPPADRPPVQ